MNRTRTPEARHPDVDLASTATLILRAGNGDRAALSQLHDRYRPILARMAHGRLPSVARGLKETDDLVQETLIAAFRHLEHFEYRREGAFLAYLRKILMNQIRQEIRANGKKGTTEPLHDGHVDPGRSPAQVVAGREVMERYEQALARLSSVQREAVIMRIELGFSWDEVAEAVERPSAGAARMLVARAVKRIATDMAEDGHGLDGESG